MPRTIHVLPDAVANQIAAGEVVERPASVVKELAENALDAGARRIEIHLVGGGKRSIRVSDDGSGMGREDALLALDRHATSKVRAAEDLRGVRSFGFRGEALPSIASVSRFTLETRAADEEVGTRVSVRGGTVTAVEDHPRTRGTTIAVESLFFNAPARARFLRARSVETRAVSEAITPLALAHPAVEIVLVSDERRLLELPAATDIVDRIAAIWGDEAASALLPLHREEAGLELRGMIQRPDAARPGLRRAQLFVGGRPFRDPALLRAADRGYRTTVPSDHRPWVFLFLDVPRGAVDVNVHPTKAEVRFRDRGAVEAAVEEAVRTALEGEESAATLDRGVLPPRLVGRERPGSSDRYGGKVDREPGAPGGRARGGGDAAEAQMALFVAGGDPLPSGPEPEAGSEGGSAAIELPEPPRLWQVHRAWILAEVRDGILLIDQHAAHERILFERIMAGFDSGGDAAQRLLFPLTLRLTPPEVRVVEDMRGLLERAGFEVEPFGGDAVIVHAVPDPHPYFDAERCLREMIEELTHGSELVRAARNQHEKLAMSFACKAAIKAGQALDPSEVQELFDQLFATRLPHHDVHGRPTTLRLSRGELERRFGR